MFSQVLEYLFGGEAGRQRQINLSRLKNLLGASARRVGTEVQLTGTYANEKFVFSGDSMLDQHYFKVEGKQGVLGGIHLEERSFAVRKWEVVTNDPDLDQRIKLAATDVPYAMAGFSQKVRDLVKAVFGRGGIRMNPTQLVIDGLELKDVTVLAARLKKFVDLLRILDFQRSEIPTRLAVNARQDPVSAVRFNNLRLLIEYFRDEEKVKIVCLEALKDKSRKVRLLAAGEVGDEGIAAIRDILKGKGREPLNDLLVRAIERMGKKGTGEKAGAFLDEIIKNERGPVVMAAVRTGADLHHKGALPALLELGPQLADAEECAEVARSLGALGSPAAEEQLLDWLGRPEEVLHVAATQALGKVGTLRAVEPLLALAKGFGVGGLKQEARKAIEQIQKRLGKGEMGGLSVADIGGSSGNVSLDGGGEVSVDEENE